MQAKKFPTDVFDSAPEHGGRHRARRTKRDRFREFTRVIVVAASVAALGLVALRVVDSSVQFDIGTLPTAAPVTNTAPAPGVTVLDATDAAGAASKLAHDLLDAGLNVLTADNYSGETEVSNTVLYISEEKYRTVAKKALKTMGKYPIEVSTDFVDPVTVIIGSDFK